jgi:hypothetical protein
MFLGASAVPACSPKAKTAAKMNVDVDHEVLPPIGVCAPL